VVAVQQLACARVAGGVDLGVALVDHLGAERHQPVDHAEDGVLVAGGRGEAKDPQAPPAPVARVSAVAVRPGAGQRPASPPGARPEAGGFVAGMREEAMITTSPSPTLTRWSRLAMRLRAAIGSPWLPVHISTMRSSGRSSILRTSTRVSGGTSRYPISAAMVMLRTMERPTKATLRWWAAAASSTCWTRWTWLAKDATTIFCSARAKIECSTGP